MSDTLSKEHCIHLRTFFRGKTLSKHYYCIYWRILRHRNSTFFYNMPHWPQLFYAMCPVLFKSNTAFNEGLCLQVRFFQSPAASIKAFCYKAMLHVLKEIPHHSPQGVQKCFPGTCIYILYTLFEYVKPRQERVCTNPRFQDSKICTEVARDRQ